MKNLYFLFFLLMLTGIFPEKGNAREEYFFTDQNPALSIIVDKKDVSSAEVKDGSIHIKVEGGEGPYSISVFSTAINSQKIKGAEMKLKDLGSGTYMIIVQDQSRTIVKKVVELSAKK